MVITRVECPSCGAVLRSTSPQGFVPSTPVSCPKCKQWFAATAPAPPSSSPSRRVRDEDGPPSRKRTRPRRDDDDDDYDDRPRKKSRKGKKKKTKDVVESYKMSPVRAIVIAVLIAVLGIMAFMLKKKWDKDAETAKENQALSLVQPADLDWPVTG